MKETRILAFDFGASSGRAMLCRWNGETISMEEIHRFSNDPVEINGTLYWDVLRLFFEIKQGLLKAKQAGGFDSIGIDTWGVDFGLLDENGYLLENPVHYRDSRTQGIMEEAFRLLPKERFYEITGTQFMEFNTVFQLLALKRQRPALLERAKTLLLMPDLFAYLLTGEKITEYSSASTTQLMDARTRQWSQEILDALGLPGEILTPIVPSGSTVGTLSPSICEELGLEPVPVIAVAGHDTQSAMAAVPALTSPFAFVSCGTWSLMGTELAEPVIDETSLRCDITNEGGYNNCISFLKNITGLWMIQESRRQWMREGIQRSYYDMEMLARAEEPFRCFIDPDDPVFTPAGNIPRRVREYCRKTGQPVPETDGQVIRCIYESLAMKYAVTLDLLRTCTGEKYDTLYIVGGGTKDGMLCQMAADSCGMKVSGGPAEATVLGNALVQLLAMGEIKTLEQGRSIMAKMPDLKRYEPENAAVWAQHRKRFEEIIGK